MILFGSSLSPFVRKALAFAREKEIEVELKSLTLGSADPAFRAASPFGKMPALQDGDFSVADSSAIVAYFEALRPSPELIPTAPQARARAIWFDEFTDTIFFAAAVKVFFNRIVAPLSGLPGDLDVADRAEREALPPVLDYIENQLTPSGFLVEDRLTLADIAVASPFANLQHAGVDLSGRPELKAWADSVLARPSFAQSVSRETAFLERWRAGQAASRGAS